VLYVQYQLISSKFHLIDYNRIVLYLKINLYNLNSLKHKIIKLLILYEEVGGMLNGNLPGFSAQAMKM